MARTKRARTRPLRHAFRIKIEPFGNVQTSWAKVIEPKSDVYLPLKAEHVRESIKLKGVGNITTCSMAICARREKDAFGHVVEGYIDWTYNRAWVVSRLDRDGYPSECYVYAHNDGIGRLNDTLRGQKKLLAELEAEGGERIIHLRVPKRSTHGKEKRGSKRDGSRTRVQPRGARQRFAIATSGAIDPKGMQYIAVPKR